MMLFDCCVCQVLFWAWEQRWIVWIVDARQSIGVTVLEKLHYFMISHEKSAKIKNRRSSLHVHLNLTSSDDRRFASWRIIITDIQSGNIGGQGGRKGHAKIAAFAFGFFDSILSSPREVCSRSISIFFGGSFGRVRGCFSQLFFDWVVQHYL